MKLLKTDTPYLSKNQWRKIFLAMSIMTLVLYTVAMVFSLCGSKYFILNYQNEQMDRIEAFLTDKGIMPALYLVFTTVEYSIVLSFVLKKLPKWYYILPFYAIRFTLACLVKMPSVFNNIYPFAFYLTIPLIDQLIHSKKISLKHYLFSLLRLVVATFVTFALQIMIFVIKNGEWSFENHIISLPVHFIYAIEYDIALLVILFTILLFINREKGDSNLWMTSLQAGGSSQTSKKQLQKSKQKKLSKTQKNKLRLLYAKFYVSQLGAFLLLMVLPFLLGKVFEFLVMYFAFAVARYILGFKYSLHYKKESLCISVGAIVFGILSLAVPFFYIVMIAAITLGVGLAVLLHLSYKYKGMFLFSKIAKPDKYAELYVIFDGDLDRHHVQIMCLHKGLNKEMTEIVCDYTDGNKKSYIAKKHSYEVKTIERKINEAIEILKANS